MGSFSVVIFLSLFWFPVFPATPAPAATEARAQVGHPDVRLIEATRENTVGCVWRTDDSTDRVETTCVRSDAGDLGLGF